jgi:hypothetical protein
VLRGTNELLARAIHDEYVRQQRTAGHAPLNEPSLATWDDLPETLRQANRAQADDLGSKLAAIHCHIAPLTEWDTSPESLSPDEVEQLAVMEHQRWLDERQRNGWTYGPTRDDVAKRHPSLVPWSKLSESEREKNRAAVRAIPALLFRAGFRAVREPPAAAAARADAHQE